MYRYPLIVVCLFGLVACQAEAPERVGSAFEREQLYDHLVQTILERDAASPQKVARLGLDLRTELERHRPAFIAAKTESDLFYALVRLSNARRDRHLAVLPVQGGLRPDHWPAEAAPLTRTAPILFSVDQTAVDSGRYFVSGWGTWPSRMTRAGLRINDADTASAGARPPQSVGDLLIAVGGMPVTRFEELIGPYVHSSTDEALPWHIAQRIPEWHYESPPELLQDSLRITLQDKDGRMFDMTLPYLDPDNIDWVDGGFPAYPGFEQMVETKTFDVWRHSSRGVTLLDWKSFDDALVGDVDRLMELARRAGWLGGDVIVDMTRSEGGFGGAYALQRLVDKPFLQTMGTLRISDVTREVVKLFEPRDDDTSTRAERQRDWIREVIEPAIEAGEAYTRPVPFKVRHAPWDSDGVLDPAPVHFSGRFVLLTSTGTGSYPDQIAAMVADNDLGLIIGTPTGGYSNTYEWVEPVLLPDSDRELAAFMWSVGQTIRPDGEVLEGNPADVDIFMPQTAANYAGYRDSLVAEAMVQLGRLNRE